MPADRTGRAGNQPAGPRYETRGDQVVCLDCGAIIAERTAHTRFHSILSGHAWMLAILKTAHVGAAIRPDDSPQFVWDDATAAVEAAADSLRAQGAAAERERCVALVRNEASEIRGDTAPLAQTIAIVLDDVADLLDEDQP